MWFKHQDLSSDAEHPHEKSGKVICALLMPHYGRMETGQLPELVGQPVRVGTEQDREKGVSNNELQVP